MPQYSGGPYRFNTWLRSHLPWFLINLGIASKGKDCEQAGGSHEWYNMDDNLSACYHCEVERGAQARSLMEFRAFLYPGPSGFSGARNDPRVRESACEAKANSTPAASQSVQSPVLAGLSATDYTSRTPPSIIHDGHSLTRSPWKRGGVIVGVAWIVLMLIFGDTAMSMVATWYWSGTFAHGFLILPISAYLIWTRRYRIASIRAIPNLWGLLLLAGLGFSWLLGHLTNVLVVQQVTLVAMLSGLVWTVMGSAVTRALLFPLAFLFFAVPIGEDLVPPLQDFTAYFTVNALQFSGVPVLWEGRVLTIPSGVWHVAEACAGVRYIIPAVTLGCLFAVVTYRTWWRRLLFLLASFLVPILANGIRAYGIVMLAHFSNNTIATGVDHFIYGWLFFGVVMFLLFWLGVRWRERSNTGYAELGHQSFVSAVSSAAVEPDENRSAFSIKPMLLTATGGVVLLSLAPLSAQALSSQPVIPTALHPTGPSVILPWKALPKYSGNWNPHFVGAETELSQTYRSGTKQVHFYLAYYVTQQQGEELINAKNSLVGGTRWVLLEEAGKEVVVNGQALHVQERIIRSSFGTRLVWSWYWVDGRFTSSPYLAKLLQAKAQLFGRPRHSAILALGTDYDYAKTDATATLEDFLQHTSLMTTLNSFSTQ